MLTFLVFYIPSVLFVGTCKDVQFRCDTTPQIFRLCDGINDCDDVSDEEPNMYGRLNDGWVILCEPTKFDLSGI